MRNLLEYLAFCAFAVALMVFSGPIIVASLTAIYGGLDRVPPTVMGNLLFVSPLFPLVLGLVALVRLKLGGVDLGELLGFHRATLGADAVLGLAIGVLGLGLALASLFLLAPYLAVPPFAQFPLGAHIFFATVGAVVPGLCEELFFRGLLFRLARRVPQWMAIAGGATAFSLWHLSTPIYLPHTFLLGLVLGIAAMRRARLAPAIMGHTLANALFGAWMIAGLPVPGIGPGQ